MIRENGTLIISSTKISDRGEYVCEVTTTGFVPVLSKPATISVIGKQRLSNYLINNLTWTNLERFKNLNFTLINWFTKYGITRN